MIALQKFICSKSTIENTNKSYKNLNWELVFERTQKFLSELVFQKNQTGQINKQN